MGEALLNAQVPMTFRQKCFGQLRRFAVTLLVVAALIGIGLPMPGGGVAEAQAGTGEHSQHHGMSGTSQDEPAAAGACCDVMAGQCVNIFSPPVLGEHAEPSVFSAGIKPTGTEAVRKHARPVELPPPRV